MCKFRSHLRYRGSSNCNTSSCKMALTLTGSFVEMLRTISRLRPDLRRISSLKQTGLLFPSFERHQSSRSVSVPSSVVPLTSLSRPPWPEVKPICPEEEQRQHAAVVQKVNSLITNEDYGRLFAVVHFAGRQWKVTNEDLILIENHIAAGCGDRIKMEKVSSPVSFTPYHTVTLNSSPVGIKPLTLSVFMPCSTRWATQDGVG